MSSSKTQEALPLNPGKAIMTCEKVLASVLRWKRELRDRKTSHK
jgi:hypothetical protein